MQEHTARGTKAAGLRVTRRIISYVLKHHDTYDIIRRHPRHLNNLESLCGTQIETNRNDEKRLKKKPEICTTYQYYKIALQEQAMYPGVSDVHDSYAAYKV